LFDVVGNAELPFKTNQVVGKLAFKGFLRIWVTRRHHACEEASDFIEMFLDKLVTNTRELLELHWKTFLREVLCVMPLSLRWDLWVIASAHIQNRCLIHPKCKFRKWQPWSCWTETAE